jgi:hypothetical protein
MRVQKRFLMLVGGLGLCLFPAAVTAQEPWGEIRAEPNPCRLEGGREECTVFLHWHTRGVERAKVFVTAEGGRTFKEREFSASKECEGDRCAAPWITHHTKYIFQLFDFTRGDRGRLLSTVEVRGER